MMRSRMCWIVAGLVAVLAVTGCSDNKSTTTNGSAGTSSHAAPQGEGALIDVNAKLLEQGFKQVQINAVEKNAAYWLLPFQYPSEMSQHPKPGNVTCIFNMVHKDYKQGDALADHRIKEHSMVRLTAYVVGSDGAQGASLPKSPEVEFSKLTPQWLATANDAFGDLGACGDLTVQ
jgi:hypothetical protein